MPDDRKPPRKPPGKPPHARAGNGRIGPGARARSRGPRARPPRPELDDAVVLYGWHPVAEALRNGKRTIHRLLATENAARRLAEELPGVVASPQIVRPSEIDALVPPDAVHQGLYAEAEPLEGYDLDTLPDDALVLALDQITDPHNVGAIVRTAAAFGVTAILTTARHSPAATGVLAKSASGGLEHVPFVVVRNLGDALDRLGTRGFLRVGLDSEGDETFESLPARRPALLVLGAEGKGLRARTRSLCDVVARLDMAGAIKSLNVSNAAAIALYALTRRL
ncbi:TrmH family RNA methyltransferase [Salinarimonas sp. NSM]|uniref:TrmH family RNA methyltransferase n=1 Tax=Salinarimonas sp. NSM TaxID=3458003 RepID=UPI0040369930